MNLKKAFFSFACGLAFMSTLIVPKAQAGIALIVVGGIEMFRPNDSGSRPFVMGTVIPGGVIGLAGSIVGLTGNLIPGLIIAALAEDGSVSQTELESALMGKYPEIADREVVSGLAMALKEKADAVVPNSQGQKFVNLNETEVRSILAVTDLSEEATLQIIQELK